MKSNLLDLFYNFIIKEASIGRIYCFLKYNIIFGTKIEEDGVDIVAKRDNPNLIVPTLIIKNREEFDQLLLEYVERALEFYDDDNYPTEVLNSKFYDNELGISREKLIMTLVWLNATVDDFNNPCDYLKKRISFFELGVLEKYRNFQYLGYSEILGGNLELGILKSRIEAETPYYVQIFLNDIDTNERIYEFPLIYGGVQENNGYIYAIHNNREKIVNDKFVKKIERKLYRVNEGLNVKEDNFENYDIGNLKDITPSFLVASNIVMGLLQQNGISKVHIPSILVERWNSKGLVLEMKRDILKRRNSNYLSLENQLNDYEKYCLAIQSNITEKFFRLFRRLDYHHSNIYISSYPYEESSELVIKVLDKVDVCNNQLLDETYCVDNKVSLMKR